MAKLVRRLNNEHVLIDSATAPLLARMRASLSSALGRPIEDGDPEMVAAASLLPYFGQGLAAADIASKAMLLQFATGDDLEAIGAHYGIARRTLHATMAVRIAVYGTFAAGTYAVSITGEAPDGTLFSYINDTWTTPVDTQTPEFTLTCAVTGDAYNGLDELINPSVSVTPSGEDAVEGVLEVLSASRGGGPETDDVYASRIHDMLLARTAAGSKAGYEALARTLDGVIDAWAPIVYGFPDSVTITVIAPSSNWTDIKAEIEASPLLPLGLGIRGGLHPEMARGVMAINWFAPSGGDVGRINAAVNAALDAVLAPLYYTYMSSLDLNLILGAVTGAGGVGAYISGAFPADGSFANSSFAIVLGYLTEHTFGRTYKGVSQWI